MRMRVSAGELFLVAAALCGAGGPSWANGRPPATVNVHFRPGESETIYLPVTFGLLVSPDDGDSFRWVCEAAVGYSGTFDPDYAVGADGALYADSDLGLRRSRDGGCTWETVGGPLAEVPEIGEVEVGPDGRIWVATSSGGQSNDVHVSADGESFASSNLAVADATWESLRTTAADPDRIYVTGFRPEARGAPAAALLRRSLDGGKTWEELPVDDFTFGLRPDLFVMGVSPTDPDLVFARAERARRNIGDTLYRSEDGGLTWTLVAEFADTISAFLIRADGETVFAGSVRACPEDITDAGVPVHGCVRKSPDRGVTWERPAEQPRLACIGERGDGTLFGCGANWDPDNFALGRSSDGETWEKVYRVSETTGPLECPQGGEQAECAVSLWPGLCMMFGICTASDAGSPAQDAGREVEPRSDGGCCRVSGDGDRDGSFDGGWVVTVVGVVGVWLAMSRRRRRRSVDRRCDR
jgi:photosystem II stability/assembly factor-like uncharacterized protein